MRQAAAELKSTEEKATVILITDGIETCEADPCALGRGTGSLGRGFHRACGGLWPDRRGRCHGRLSGGKHRRQYIEAKDAGGLVTALQTTVAVAEPERPTVPEPEPAPIALEKNFDPVIVLAEGQHGLTDRDPDDAFVILRMIQPEAALSEETISVDGRQTRAVSVRAPTECSPN